MNARKIFRQRLINVWNSLSSDTVRVYCLYNCVYMIVRACVRACVCVCVCVCMCVCVWAAVSAGLSLLSLLVYHSDVIVTVLDELNE